MYKINDDVVHKSAGVCYIFDIVTQNFGNGDTTYYLLKPKFPSVVNKALEIFLPIEKQEQFIRRPLNKSEALNLIRLIPSFERVWIVDAKTRKLKFEEVYQSGDLKGICQLIKLLYAEPEFFAKPMSLTDKNFLLKLKNHVFDEFAVALEILPTEVEEFIKKFMIN